MIIPEIYQSSTFDKPSMDLVFELRTPYGNKLAVYLYVLVPLFFLLALVTPKQSTANSFSSPFLVKAYLPGMATCNLGIVDRLSIEKNNTGDSLTVDGLPTSVRVTLTIKDLYSDMATTPSGQVALFMANSSMIEYIATSCGVNLITPNIKRKINMVVDTAIQAIGSVDDTVHQIVFGSLDNLIMSMTGV